MLKCPKCHFEQPEDIYCAKCGVNMKNFVPPRPSLFKTLLTNQLLHITLLFIAIIAYVIYDLNRTHPSHTKVVSAAHQNAIAKKIGNDEPTPPPPTNETSLNPTSPPPPPAPRQASVPNKKKGALPPGATALGTPSGSDSAASGASATKSSLQISFFQASKSAIADLQRESQSSNVSGDAIGGVILKKKLAQLKNSGELKNISGNRYKLDGHPISLFKGQRNSEGSKNIGLYFQINPIKNDTAVTQLEIKSWGSLKMQEPDETLFTSEMTLNGQYSAYISGFLPKDKVFGDEEKAIFEADRALKIYNQEDFWDGNTDLIIVIELP